MDGALLPRPVRPARGRDRALDRVPRDRAPAPGDHARAARDACAASGPSSAASASTTSRSRPPRSPSCPRSPGSTTCSPRRTSPTRAAPTRSAWPPRWPRAPAPRGVTHRRAASSVTGIRTDARPGHRRDAPTAATSSARPSCSPPGCGPASSARRCGVDVPLQAAEHYYLLTEPMAGVAPGPAGDRGPGPVRVLPRGGRRPARRPVRAGRPRRGSSTARRADFAFGTHRAGLGPAWRRSSSRRCTAIPALADVGVRKFFCGPESFTADLHPMLGPGARGRRRTTSQPA